MAQPDLFNIPLRALGHASLYEISLQLNAEKIIPSDNGELRDWRGLAQRIGIPGQHILAISNGLRDPFSKVLEMWTRLPVDLQKETPTIGSLKMILEDIDRWDVVDDTAQLFEQDAIAFMASLQSRAVELESENAALTIDDNSRQLDPTQPYQMYDAFLLFAEEDSERARTIVDELEGRGLKICYKERDLLPGAFEHSATLKLIAERCSRVIAIMSESFLRTSQNKFFVSYAQSVGVANNSPKLIPVIYENCNIPPEISFSFRLVFTTSNVLYNFYDKLYQSVRPASSCRQTATRTPISTGAVPRALNMQSNVVNNNTQPVPCPVNTSFLCEQSTSEDVASDTGYISDGSTSKKSTSTLMKIRNKLRMKKKTKVALEAT